MILRRLFGRRRLVNIVKDLDGGAPRSMKALIYYKTDPFNDPSLVDDYTHSNNWEIVQLVKILNSLDFSVDVLDRNTKGYLPEDDYALFLGLGAGNSGRYYADIAQRLPSAIKIMLCMGPAPDLSNELVLAQYAAFKQRTGIDAPPQRTVSYVTGDQFKRMVELTDYIFAIGEEGMFSPESYKQYGKPVLTFLPGLSPDIPFFPAHSATKSGDRFLCFAGNGLICKGVDLLVEAFRDMPDMELVICGPDTEPAFNEAYSDHIAKSSNISFEGFIKIKSEKFRNICKETGFVIFHSSSEGCATSVATAMRAGLIPVVNRETGLDVSGCGILIPRADDSIEAIKRSVREAAAMSDEERTQRVFDTLAHAAMFSQAGHTSTMTLNLIRVLKENYEQINKMAYKE